LPISKVTFQKGIGITFVGSVYLDSNVLSYARDRKSQKYQEASTIIGELLAQQVNIFISDLVIDEVWWTLLRAWYKADTRNKLRADKIKKDPTILPRYYVGLIDNTNKIFNLPHLNILPFSSLPKDRIIRALDLITSYNNLMPRDSFHLALVNLYNVEGFVTSDNDFDNLSIPFNLMLYKY